MNLGELIKALEAADQYRIVRNGFCNPHCDRGSYYDLAFNPCGPESVSELLRLAKSAVGHTFRGWKGCDFTMGEHTTVRIGEEGHCGEEISGLLLDYMLNDAVPIPCSPEPAKERTKTVATAEQLDKASQILKQAACTAEITVESSWRRIYIGGLDGIEEETCALLAKRFKEVVPSVVNELMNQASAVLRDQAIVDGTPFKADAVVDVAGTKIEF